MSVRRRDLDPGQHEQVWASQRDGRSNIRDRVVVRDAQDCDALPPRRGYRGLGAGGLWRRWFPWREARVDVQIGAYEPRSGHPRFSPGGTASSVVPLDSPARNARQVGPVRPEADWSVGRGGLRGPGLDDEAIRRQDAGVEPPISQEMSAARTAECVRLMDCRSSISGGLNAVANGSAWSNGASPRRPAPGEVAIGQGSMNRIGLRLRADATRQHGVIVSRRANFRAR